jgi:riboflavin synthase
MFTGIVEELGRVRAITPNDGGARIEIEAKRVLEDTELGASIAVNGCCLTVVDFTETAWSADAVIETLERTNLGALHAGDPVNLERPVRLADRLGGHLVQGHVDAVGRITEMQPEPDGSTRVRVEADSDILRYVVEKGSITVDGISLTFAAVTNRDFTIAVIPHTLAVTTLGTKRPGATVNLEVDVVAKYIEKLLPASEGLRREDRS